jgi:hypothetical protein
MQLVKIACLYDYYFLSYNKGTMKGTFKVQWKHKFEFIQDINAVNFSVYL